MMIVAALLVSAVLDAGSTSVATPVSSAERFRTAASDLLRSVDSVIDKEDSAYHEKVEAAWQSFEDYAIEVLDSVPDLPAEVLARKLASLANSSLPNGPAADETDELETVTAVRLCSGGHEGVVVAIGLAWSGTVSLFEPGETGSWKVRWRIRAVGAEHLPLRDDLGRWAWFEPGYHDGPLFGTVRALPPTSGGVARFAIDAITRPAMGDLRPGQISVWSWAGGEPDLQFIGGYQTSAETWSVRVEGSRLVARTVVVPGSFFLCGSCENYILGSWTLDVSADEVLDLGNSWDYPELRFVDQVLDRVLRCQAGSPDISEDDFDALRDLVEENQREIASFVKNDNSSDTFGMLSSWAIRPDQDGTWIDLSTDELPGAALRIVERDGLPFISEIKLPQDEEP